MIIVYRKLLNMSDIHSLNPHGDGHPGHETSDADVKKVTKFGLNLVVICGLAMVLMWVMLNYFASLKTKAAPPLSPFAGMRELPPGPRLQVEPVRDLVQVRALEDSLLTSYGWIVREAGIVRIPIDRALELVAQRGLPTKSQSAGGKAQSEKGGLQP